MCLNIVSVLHKRLNLEDGEIEVDMAWEAFTFLVLQICTGSNIAGIHN